MYELLADIMATASILIKMGRDDILDDRKLFVEFLNQLGFKSLTGNPLTVTYINDLALDSKLKKFKNLVQEFNKGFQHVECLEIMRQNDTVFGTAI